MSMYYRTIQHKKTTFIVGCGLVQSYFFADCVMRANIFRSLIHHRSAPLRISHPWAVLSGQGGHSGEPFIYFIILFSWVIFSPFLYAFVWFFLKTLFFTLTPTFCPLINPFLIGLFLFLYSYPVLLAPYPYFSFPSSHFWVFPIGYYRFFVLAFVVTVPFFFSF